MGRIHFKHLYTVPLICYDHLKRAPIEVKRSPWSCQARIRGACVSELACMRVGITFEAGKYSFRAFSYHASGGFRHAHINLSLSTKWCFRGSQTRTRCACVSETRMISVLLWWAPSLNDCSKLKGQYTDVKSGCVTSVWPSLNPHSLSLKTFLVLLSL